MRSPSGRNPWRPLTRLAVPPPRGRFASGFVLVTSTPASSAQRGVEHKGMAEDGTGGRCTHTAPGAVLRQPSQAPRVPGARWEGARHAEPWRLVSKGTTHRGHRKAGIRRAGAGGGGSRSEARPARRAGAGAHWCDEGWRGGVARNEGGVVRREEGGRDPRPSNRGTKPATAGRPKTAPDGGGEWHRPRYIA